MSNPSESPNGSKAAVARRVYPAPGWSQLTCVVCGAVADGTERMPEGWLHHQRRGAMEVKPCGGLVTALLCDACSRRAEEDPATVPAAVVA